MSLASHDPARRRRASSPYSLPRGCARVKEGRSARDRRELALVPHETSAFGEDAFGRRAEAAARFFGTPQYIAGQTVAVVIWIALNAAAISFRWDPYPFILL